MNIYQLIGRNIDVTDAMRNYAEEKLEKLDRFSDQIVDAKVVMSYDHQHHAGEPARVEVQLNVPNGIVRAEEAGQDSYAAVDKVVDKLERQLKRFKGRMLAKRHEDSPEPTAPPQDDYDEEDAQIVRTKSYVLRPMAPEDAALQMEALGHDFYMFRSADTDKVSVIYLRNDGNYGVLEPEN